MSVTWVLNGSSKYEISSKEHLLQLMSQGSLYTDAGTPPADFWDGDYEQTADIDLNADTNITPIGVNGDTFSGSYDGGSFSISNWSYDGSTAGESKVGLFGATYSATLENIKLRGVWIGSAVHYLGFLVGFFSAGTMRNVDGVFDEGSTLSDAITEYGAIAGGFSGTSTYAVSVGGIINTANISPNADGGGVTGSLSGPNHVGLRNAAVWPNGLTGNHVGGIASILHGDTNMTYCVNAMVGDITGDKCGGIIGYTSRGGGTDPFSNMVNSMKGNITGTTYAGGIVGEAYGAYGNFGPFDVMNYMTGNIVSTNNTSGGIVGFSSRRTGSHSLTISNTINAMNGTVDDATIGVSSNTNTVSSKIDVSFGLTYTTATYGSTSDAFTGTTSTLVPELSYIPLTFTDNASNSYEYQMVFGNVGGHSSYSQYTHAILSKNDIKGPYTIDFDLTSDTTEFVTYLSVDSNSAYTDGSLTILGSSAQVVYDYAGTTLYPLVHWVLNGDSKYEISSKEHLIQLMNSGTLYANAGSTPTDWRLSSYIQTADIDLEGDSTNIVPIWCGGGYDGNGFTVFNWVYVEPSYPSTPTVDHVGFFDRTYSNAVVKNFRMAGVCSISGFKTQAAFVSSYFLESSSVYNIEVDLSPGSFIQNTNSSSFNTRIGGVCAYIATTGTVTDVTLKGELTITPSTNANTASTMGGIAGDIANSGPCTLLRNLATFPNPLKGQMAGGITGRIYRTSVTKVLNAMTGDITQNPVGSYIGGIAGLVIQNVVSETSEFVNSMKGNITCNATNSHCAGMFGYLVQDSGATIHSMFNYMTGDITNTFSSSNAAGLVSLGNANTNLTTSINAMNGQVRMPTTNEPSSGAESNIDISFGLTYDIERNITTTPLGLPTDPEVGLPIFDFIATDPDSVVHTFDFVFGNLPRTFNQLKIVSSGEYFNLSELEIYDMTDTNVALLGTASAADSVSGGTVDGLSQSGPSLGNDGGTDGTTVADLSSSGGVTWTLDLDREYTLKELNRVVFYNRGGDSTVQDRAIGSVITFHSSDGEGPEEVATLTNDLIQTFVVTPKTVTWVLDSNSKYEISSREHLIQLMHEGTLYANAGSVPGQTTDWYREDYIQTVDIDLLGDSTNIKPIGVSANFHGEYDGNGFTVSNWSYVDTSPTDLFVGFFGFINNGTVKNLRLAGVCTITGFHTYAGMLAGRVGNGTVYNIEVDLSPGSHITQGDTTGTQTIVGGVFGWIISDFATCTAVTLRGQLDSIVPNPNTTYRLTGGISGKMSERASLTLARNLATFPSGLSGQEVGGIVGNLDFATLSKVLNAMTGDITNNLTGLCYLGGIVGNANQGNVSSQSEWINSMKGNITNSALYSGGIVGRQKPEVGFSQHSWMNYMGGDITSSYRAGGMLGLAAAATSLETSINAMNGFVVDPMLAENSDIASAPITIDTSYGLTFTTNVNNATTTPITGLPTDPKTGLPIVDLTATDADGVVHTFEFVFGNIPDPLTITPRALSLSVAVGPVNGATAYRLTSQKTGSPKENVVKNNFTDLNQTITNVTPETEYTIRLYSTDGSGYSLVDESTVTTLENSASNYDVNSFGNDGKFDLTSFDSNSISLMSGVMNELFTTGDEIEITVTGSRGSKKSKFVNRGSTVALADSEALVAPFSSDAGAGQTFTMELSDSSTATVAYDETSNSVTVDGGTYAPGSSFVLDGKKCGVYDL